MAYEMDVKFTEKNAVFNAEFGGVEFLPTRIMPATKDTLGGIKVGEGLTITSDGTLSADAYIEWNTVAYWESQRSLVTKAGVIYVYNDYRVVDGVKYPNFKIGDGKTYLVDLPFNSIDPAIAEELDRLVERVDDHIADTESHVSESDREFWNNKVTSFISEDNPEQLVLSKL